MVVVVVRRPCNEAAVEGRLRLAAAVDDGRDDGRHHGVDGHSRRPSCCTCRGPCPFCRHGPCRHHTCRGRHPLLDNHGRHGGRGRGRPSKSGICLPCGLRYL